MDLVAKSTSRVTLREGVFIDTDWDNVYTKVRITDVVNNVHSTGHAKFNPEDTYDFNFGYNLALTRAKARLFAKLAKKFESQVKDQITHSDDKFK